MKSRHFSHPHDLTLNEVLRNLDDGETEGAVCYGCLQPITAAGHAFFSCDECRNFFLHKTCAELPQEIEYAAHPTHPLELLTRRSCGANLFPRQPHGVISFLLQRYRESTKPCDCCLLLGSVVHTVEKASSGSHIIASPARSCYVSNVFCYHLTYLGRLKMCYFTLTLLNQVPEHLIVIHLGHEIAAE
ncbi:hypothetical protein RJ640_010806 [Escallonia rubra]|uniref:DC1 domain-containing protein n=1 Tax=Escallonia rubra TaxID=112253 RepID=A0AA88R0N7_9ASTE|nr:hypothetical protein RJ640_010806 [Escallonia rubra]